VTLQRGRYADVEDLLDVKGVLQRALGHEVQEVRMGTSKDTYWAAPARAKGQFARVRERDGIRQLTVKGQDRGGNEDRLEVDLDCTSPTFRIHRFMRALLGKPAGVIEKTYWVFELESEHDTVCCYEVLGHEGEVFVECEAKTTARVHELVALVMSALVGEGLHVESAGGSLFELFVAPRAQGGLK